jgi:hypothetical protein
MLGVLRARLELWDSSPLKASVRHKLRQKDILSELQNSRVFSSFPHQRRFTKLLTITSTASIHTVDDVVFALSERTLTRCWAPGFEGSFRLH